MHCLPNFSSGSSFSLGVEDSSVSMVPFSHEQSMLNDVKTKQSQFFNSLFPSRANRFGFPVYPERTFGIPSQMKVPVSFAGFSPGNSIQIEFRSKFSTFFKRIESSLLSPESSSLSFPKERPKKLTRFTKMYKKIYYSYQAPRDQANH